jgi:peroxin-3
MDQNVRELEAFSAVVYSSNFDLELLGANNKGVPARETDLVDTEAASSSFSQVLVEKEVDADLEEEKKKEEIIEPHSRSAPPSAVPEESAFNEPGPETLADSAFEEAWGKATDDGNTSLTEEKQPTQ